MLIKVYTIWTEDLFILENVSDVKIHANCKNYPPETGSLSDPSTQIVYDQCADGEKYPPAKVIDFTQDNLRKRLYVFNKAYVCNDRGQTIEKVDAGN